MALMRLDKLLALQKGFSRKEAAALVRGGAVRVDGQAVTDPALHVCPAAVTLHGHTLGYQDKIYLLLNKPAGVLTAARDAKQPTVLDVVPAELQRRGVQPVGRLDKDTTGLLLLTDDGALAHRLLSPHRHVWKVYRARLDIPPRPGAEERFARGLKLEEFTCLPARLTRLDDSAGVLYEVRLREGKFHQVKRMFAAEGARVLQLCRVSFGALTLPPELPEGACRPLTDAERTALLADAEAPEKQV